MIKIKILALLCAMVTMNVSAQNVQSQNESHLNKVWFITGCDKGLGAAFAKNALKSGYKVIATGLNADSVKQSVGENTENLLVVKCDIRNSTDIKTAVNFAIGKFGRIDILLNNAGYGQIGWFENTTEQQIRDQFETNLFGTMNVTREILPYMRKQKSGKILTITSVSGLFSVAGSAVYSSSKFAVEGWMEGLLQEVKPLGITGMLIEPSFFRTDFLDKSSVKYPKNDIEEYSAVSAEFKAWHDKMNHKQIGDPQKLASVIIALINTNNHPIRFVAGSEGTINVLNKLESVIEEVKKWEDLSASTDGNW